jgi:hypothetical protein
MATYGDYLVHVIPGTNADQTEASEPIYLIRQHTPTFTPSNRWGTSILAVARALALRKAKADGTQAWMERADETYEPIRDDSDRGR